MANWHPDKSKIGKPAFKSLAEQISSAIHQGLLEPGERLPTQRDLAADIHLSLQTVSRAYEELHRRGLIQGEIGRGTYVKTIPRFETTPFRSAPALDAVVEMSIYKPVLDTIHQNCIKEALAALSHDTPKDIIFSFRPNQGLPRHLHSAVEWLNLCGLTVDRERILLTNGVTQGTTSALLTVAKPGGVIVAEAIGHHSLADLCSCFGLKLRGLTIDQDGIVPEALEKACKKGGVTALYLIPTLANPTVYLMPEERRRTLVAIARKYDIFIIENDVLGPLVTNKPPPFAALAPERTFYLTSFTKCLMPGLRTGYLAIPHGMLRRVRSRLLATAWMATPMIAEIASRWVVDGTARRLLLWQRRALHERHRIVQQILGNRQFASHPSALHIWVPLTGRWRSDPFVTQALDQGVAVAPAGPFLIDCESDVRAIRVSLGAAGKKDLRRGLRVIDQLLDREAEFNLSSF